MVMSQDERDVIVGAITKIEAAAAMLPEHSTTRMGLYTMAKDLKQLIAKSVTTSTFRGAPVKKD